MTGYSSACIMRRATSAITEAWLLVLFSLALHASSARSQPLSLHLPITYEHYYRSESNRANLCKIHHKPQSALNGASGYVPFIGTSMGRDPQLLVLRLYYSTVDYPVKYFVVVVPERALSPPHGAIWYEVQHLKEYAVNVVIVTCARTPTVAEGWNAVFQAFPEETWGVYCARDTVWMPGSLTKLAGHMWNASRDNSIEVALMNWTYSMTDGLYNAFGITKSGLGRFGLFDENIYPAYFEDGDFKLRQSRMQPPMRVQVLHDVIMHHGKKNEQHYVSGVQLPNDPNNEQQERRMRNFVDQRWKINGAYLRRKWGCEGDNWLGCQYQTPFNKSLPVWYWYTSKQQRLLDRGLNARDGKMYDGDGVAVYDIPPGDNYIGWAGYKESANVCRIAGPVGIVARNESGLWCV